MVEKATKSDISVKNTTNQTKFISIKISEAKLYTKYGAPLESDALFCVGCGNQIM
ncbi:MAG: hypothetical protein MUP85_09570 [Candidatus Lokiarchaeota archaeon]|nr:hypothetical protein [Candidatus Lokiarchaeota archaeon]